MVYGTLSMSLQTRIERSLFRPRVWFKNNILYAETAPLIQLCCLFSYRRLVKVYQKGRFIKIESKWLWFFTSQRFIHFSRIRRIETEFSATRTAIERPEYYEEFSIFLCLQDPYEYCWLISFGGERRTFFADLFENQGDQEITFQDYYMRLKEMTAKNNFFVNK